MYSGASEPHQEEEPWLPGGLRGQGSCKAPGSGHVVHSPVPEQHHGSQEV